MKRGLVVLAVSALVQTANVAPASAAPTWEIMSVPSTSWDRSINSIVAIGANDAIAVGSVEEQFWLTEWRALVWRFDGTRWREHSAPPNAGELNSVAAASANDVWTLSGSMYNPERVDGPYAHRWNGTGWSTTRIPDHPSGGKLSAYEVAVAGGTVWVVGSYETEPATWPDSNPAPAILRWSGSGWTYVDVPAPAGEARLYDVHVVSANDVWATGVETVAGGERPYVVRWDGVRWSQATTPTTVRGVRLIAGTARANGEVWFGGALTDSDDVVRDTFAMRSTGSGWTVTPTPRAPSIRSYITTFGERGSELWAGGEGETPLLRWTGGAWEQGSVPALDNLSVRKLVATPDNGMWATGRGSTSGSSLSGPYIARLTG